MQLHKKEVFNPTVLLLTPSWHDIAQMPIKIREVIVGTFFDLASYLSGQIVKYVLEIIKE
eukprot:c20995_g3_i1 orf=2-178(-)